MMLTLNDGRTELWQWDTGRTLSVDADCSQVHFSNKFFGRSIDVDVTGGVAIIPDILLQTDKDLNVWAFVGTAENGYTKISKTFKVNRRNKPADYVFTQTDQMTLQTIQRQIGDLSDLTTEAKDTLVDAINEAARTGGGYYAPAVDAEGNLTWAASKADMPSVDGTNIKGPQGVSGVYVGSGDMPEGYNVQIDPNGTPEELPTTLPNPNALTFTGAVTGSYDGSAPLEVAIPSGGDAGKSVRHIATVSVTAGTTNYNVTVDSNGDALNLESVYILTNNFWSNNGSYVQVDVNGKVITKAFGQSGSPQVLELEKMGELQKLTNIPKPSNVGISFGDYYNGKSAVISVGFWASAAAVDTTIEIYGVDA